MFQISDLFHRVSGWLAQPDKNQSSIVISSRVRLARNLTDFNFTNCNPPEKQDEVIRLIENSLADSKLFAEATLWRLSDLTSVERQFLLERQLISRKLVMNHNYAAVAVERSENFSFMVNEEDHLRLQTIRAGLSLGEAYRIIDTVDSELGDRLNFGFSTRYGYLTACPTNTGTGLRASVMVHLPALVKSKQIRKILPAVSRFNLAIRGIFGEGTDVMGNLFQISNQLTLGKNELETIDNIEQIAHKLIGYEEETRVLLLEDQKRKLPDQIWRAYGTLKYARNLNLTEAMELISLIRLGIDLGIITQVSYSCLNKILLFIHSSHLLLKSGVGSELSHSKVNTMRADFMREELE